MKNLYKDFGRRVRKARLAGDLTQEQVADRVGLTRTSITNIERGSQHIALHQLFLIASAVGVDPQVLLPDQERALDELVSPGVLKKLDADEESLDFAVRVLRKSSGGQPAPTARRSQ